MPRLSNTPQEAAHISRIARGMPFGGVVWVNLKTGLRIDGVLTAERAGNNGGAGNWQFYGELELTLRDGNKKTIDYLDINSVTDAWRELGEEYQRLGLISAVDFPGNA